MTRRRTETTRRPRAPHAPREVEVDVRWQILLPPGWASIPTHPPEAARAAIGRILDAMLAGKPRDELVEVRIELDRRLRAQAEDAARAGASHLHALAEPVRGAPVAASLVTTPIHATDADALAAALSTALGRAEGVQEHGTVELGDRPALRRVRRRPFRTDLAPTLDQTLTAVDYVVPTSERSLLLLTFSTTTEPVVTELVALFDAVAQTLRPRAEREEPAPEA